MTLQERYERISKTEWFRNAYVGKSLGHATWVFETDDCVVMVRRIATLELEKEDEAHTHRLEVIRLERELKEARRLLTNLYGTTAEELLQDCDRLQRKVERLTKLPLACYEDAYRDARQVIGTLTLSEATSDPFALIGVLMQIMETRLEIRHNTKTIPLLEALAAERKGEGE